MNITTIRKSYIKAFNDTIPRWQEARNRSGSGLEAMAYHAEVGAGRATYTRSTARVRPCVSDFVADVELTARRALRGEELRYFFKYYRDDDGQIDEVPKHQAALDESVREKLGKHFIAVGIAPLSVYMQARDVRDIKALRG